MSYPAPGSGLVLSLKIALISTCVLSVAVMLKLSVPVVTDFAVHELPLMYSSVISWLRPPYLYLVINGIIISIVASSKLQLQKPEEPSKQQEIIPPPMLAVEVPKASGDIPSDYIDGVVECGSGYQDLIVIDKVVPVDDSSVNGAHKREKGEVVEKEITVTQGSDKALVSFKSVQPAQRSDSMEFLVEKEEKKKPLVSARFGSKFKKSPVKANPEAGKAVLLGVSKPKRNDTLESTWKMITDSRPMPLTRHLKKFDTWDSHLRLDGATSPPPPPEKMNKSETFSENESKLSRESRQGSGKLRKEPSLSQDELNRRVEAFIKKFNEEMRRQRQESLNQYQEKISRGAY
ncbi:hypothetical protein P3X46_027057 [Hevea brasiliensis]|uniref:DUF4408 domain-containing protein n=1 Tax=Hevea brasiliensis TaxID=3981 RepID=A0ABQ9L1L0_HEVBR|nr:uncharacterized protein LOC110643747 [Hevea brasiliensis]KAJ9153637.1 hypothetical protein P3X46_027057 [Hevea brasiliensis]